MAAGVGGGDELRRRPRRRERRCDPGRLRLAGLADAPPDRPLPRPARAARRRDGGGEAEVYVTAPGAEIDESHPLVGALESAHEEVFGAAPERDVTRWFSDASVLSRYGIATVNYGTSSGLPDPEYGENLEIDGLVKIAEVYASAAQKVCGAA